MKYLLMLPLILSACAAGPATQQGAGFAPQATDFSASNVPAAQTAAATVSTAGLSRAAESAFGRGLARDDVMVQVAGRAMGMRIVESRCYSFAVLQERGVPLSLKGQPDLTDAAVAAVRANSRCATSGRAWSKRYANGAFPKYAVHLTCG